jgi:hypothetical protein
MSLVPATPEECRAMAAECGRRAQQYANARHHYSAKLEIDQALQLTLRALELEQITNSLSSTPPAMTKPNAVPSTALGTPSMQEPQ